MRFAFPVLWTVFIACLSLMPGESLPSRDWMNRIHADKIVHAVLYGILVLLYIRAFVKSGSWPLHVIAMSCGIAVTTGFVIELLQWAGASGRYFDLLDIMANITGVIIGAILYRIRVI